VSSEDRNENYRAYCQDGIDAIDSIVSYFSGMTFAEFERDRKTRDAVERNILIIAEVIRRMPEFEVQFDSAHRIRGFANRLRHEYDGVDNLVTWGAITGPRLSELRAAFESFARGG
jgi:uncharacterized protein with HEPN domain